MTKKALGNKSNFSILLIVLLNIFCNKINAQSNIDTCYKSYLQTYSISNSTLELKDLCRTSDGGYLLVGKYTWDSAAIIKLNNKGNIEWSKNVFGPIWANRTLNTNDGNIIVTTFYQPNGPIQKSQVTKLTNTGVVIWSKELEYYSGGGGNGGLTLYDIKEANDGSLVMIFNNSIGLGYTFNYIAKIDINGSLLWKKEIKHNVLSPILKSIVIDGNDIYIAADFYNYAGSQFDLAKLDLATGNIIWKRRFEVSIKGIFDPHLAVVNNSLFVSLIAIKGNGVNDTNTVFVSKHDKNTGLNNSVFHFLNPKLSFNTTYYTFFRMGPAHFNKTEDNNLFFAQLCYYNNDTCINVTKFSTTGNIIWSKNYKNYRKNDVWSVKSDKDELMIVGRHYKGYPNSSDNGFVMRLDNNGNISNSPLTNNDSCYNISINPTVSTIGLTEMPESNFLNTVDINVVSLNYTPLLKPIISSSQESCHTLASNCNSLTIIGIDSLCENNGNVTYTAVRNQGCTNKITWLFDTNYVKPTTISDTSITVKFILAGNTIITGKLINPCASETIATKNIKINRSANALNLGDDLFRCLPINLTLNAKTGYKKYIWDNGTTDSILTVSNPGQYSLEVTDFCNFISRDTIAISTYNPSNISDTIKGCNSIIYNGVIFTMNTILKDTIKGLSGCDSIFFTHNLIINNIIPKTINDTISGCNIVNYLGINYQNNYTKKDTLKTSYGCDSIFFTHHIIVHKNISLSVVDTIIGRNLIIYKGLVYSSNTIIYDTIKTKYGCDSLFYKHHIVIHQIKAITNIDTLSGCKELLYKGILFTSNNTINDTIKTINGCDSIYELHNLIINPLPILYTVKDTILCYGEEAKVLTLSNESVFWVGSNSNPLIIKPFKDTIYKSIAISSFGCKDSMTTNISVQQFKLQASYQPNPSFKGDNILINTSSNFPYAINYWNADPKIIFTNQTSKSNNFIADTTCKILIKGISTLGCKDSIAINVFVKRKSSLILVPNAFSPNNDGVNDSWEILDLIFYPSCIVSVFNRYGQKIYHSLGYSKPWNGRLMGDSKIVPLGTYYYLINLGNGESILRGSVTIIK